MKKITQISVGLILAIFTLQAKGYAQSDFEWRLTNATFNSADPDGSGVATGSVTFTLQVRTRVAAVVIPITAMTTGFCWQNANALVPTGVACGANSIPQPSNISMSPAFSGYTYNNVNQCSGAVNFTTGGQLFDRRAVGTVDGGLDVNISNAWTNVFTVTLWSRNAAAPQAGYVVLNSSNAGTPGPFSNYDISDASANAYEANSLTYTSPLALVAGTLPVTFSNYDVKCTDKGVALTWATATEQNSDKFEIQRSENGLDWITIDNVAAAGNSIDNRNYQYLDLKGGTAQYRIRQVDKDGRFTYTAVKRTDCKASQFDVVLYPVPAKDNITVVIKSDRAVRTDLQILDINGRLVRRIPTQINKGNTNVNLDVSVLPAGQYMLSGSEPSLQINKKFTIVR
jgi:Secretion system C-terminal sorting domain